MPANTIPQNINVLDLLCYQPMTEHSTSALVEVHHDLQQAVRLSVRLYCTAFWSYPWLFRPCTCRPQHRFCDTQSLLPALSSSKCRPYLQGSHQHQSVLQELLQWLDRRWWGTKLNGLRAVYVFCHYVMLLSHCGEYPCECKNIYSRQIRQKVANIRRMGLRMQFATNRNDRKMIAIHS